MTIAAWRDWIETTFGELTDTIELARHGAHTFHGLFARTPPPSPPTRSPRSPYPRDLIPQKAPQRRGDNGCMAPQLPNRQHCRHAHSTSGRDRVHVAKG